MTSTPARRRRRGQVALAALVGVLAASGTTALAAGLNTGTAGPPQPPAAGPPAPASTRPDAGPPPSVGPPGGTSASVELETEIMAYSVPVGLEIPAIGVQSGSIVPLGRDPDGSLEVPREYSLPGWFEEGPAPGQFGPAVIAGHVDNKSGPAVFYRLGELRPNDTVAVLRADGSTAEFLVDRVERYPKDSFPTNEVYGDLTQRSELRLITCGGKFDASIGHYVDNVVVYAHLV